MLPDEETPASEISEQEAGNLESFNQRKDALTNVLNGQNTKLAQVKERVARQVAETSEKFKDDPTRLAELVHTIRSSEMISEQAIKKTTLILNNLRPRFKPDMEERKWAYDNLGNEIRNNCPENLPLWFHGTSIYFAEEAIKTKELSSSEDRLGFQTSWDVAGQVSVTAPINCETTIQSYTDLYAEGQHLPAGCIFALLPGSGEEAQSGQSAMLMENISFRENPERLFGVVTSTENLPKVKEWMTKSGFDAGLVYAFREFPGKLSEYKNTPASDTSV